MEKEEKQMPFAVVIKGDGTEVLENAIKRYGYQGQLQMAIEEASELTKAICKLLRSGEHKPDHMVYSETARENVLEEVADIIIMAVQLDMMLDKGGETQNVVDYKIERLKERLAREE